MNDAPDTSDSEPRGVVVLGSTGSIGQSAASVLEHDGGRRLRAFGLAAHRNIDLLLDQVRRLRPRFVTVTEPEAARGINGALAEAGTELLTGPDAVEQLVSHESVRCVLAAVVGAAGLRGTWAALEAGKTVALANKETLVVAGPLVMALAQRRGARIIPVDSEHSAIFQCLASGRRSEVRRVILTSSGGPFRGRSARSLSEVTPDEALRHPTWRMGPKITIDSATLMNKALELIEARWLFDLEPDQLSVIIHPESIVHSMVEFTDGSVFAQLSPPDMRLPIQYALTYPDRADSPCRRLDLARPLSLQFEPPDEETFPCLSLGFEVMKQGGTAGAALNAANEIAVERFLSGNLAFLEIPRVCRAVVDHHPFDPSPTLETLWSVDAWARKEAVRWTC
jgi:1-deoxy-D-xylulose-5-phosphate reductoisomerase